LDLVLECLQEKIPILWEERHNVVQILKDNNVDVHAIWPKVDILPRKQKGSKATMIVDVPSMKKKTQIEIINEQFI
jgi:hypothetical protein